MKSTNSAAFGVTASLVTIGLAWGVSACTHSAMTASADAGAQSLATGLAASVEPQYFGEQFASQQLALQAKPDEAPVETF